MAKVTERWKPNHSDVVHRLRDQLGKLGIKTVDFSTEVQVHVGPGVSGQLDLVAIQGYRTRQGKRGNLLALFEVKSEFSGLVSIVWHGLRQLGMYSLALDYPHLYLTKQEEIKKLSNSLAYRVYLVIQKQLWDEFEDLTERDRERLETILNDWQCGIITFDNKWSFKLHKDWANPPQQETSFGKPVKRAKTKQTK